MNRLTRTLCLLLFATLIFLGSAGAALAQKFGGSIESNVSKTVDAVIESETDGTPSHESFVDDNLTNLQSSLYLALNGPPSDVTSTSYNAEEQRILSQRYGRGVIGELAQGVALLYTQPISSRTYIADVMESAHIIPEAQAQGLGFSSLDPILEVWKVFRNLAYLFFVIIFLVIGFMIMFRQKISGQTVVTAQQAIPGIIVSLIFVTFSYAIAGFMIDLMYLLMYLMIGIFSPPGGTEILNKNFFIFGWELVTGADRATANMNEVVEGFAAAVLGEGGPAAVIGVIGGLTLGLVVSIAILIGVFKMFFELLKTYITIILTVATAPLTLMMGAIPGKGNFSQWIKLLVGNLMAFPTVLMMLIIYHMITGANVTDGGFLPPFLIGREGAGGAILTLVGIGLLLIIPEMVKQMKKTMGAEGGIWEQLGGDMLKNAKAGWTGEGIGGWGAKRLLTPAALGAASAATAGTGALIGGTISKVGGKTFKEGAKTGALWGAAIPTAAALGIPQEAYQTARHAVSGYVGEKTFGEVGRRMEQKQGVLRKIGQALSRTGAYDAYHSQPLRPGDQTVSSGHDPDDKAGFEENV